jgi:hypothetical protein
MPYAEDAHPVSVREKIWLRQSVRLKLAFLFPGLAQGFAGSTTVGISAGLLTYSMWEIATAIQRGSILISVPVMAMLLASLIGFRVSIHLGGDI